MIAGVLVLYYPKPLLLRRLLESLEGQVDTIIAVDNTPEPDAHVLSWLQKFQSGSVCYHSLRTNKGIAEAQNIGIAEATKAKCSHVLLLDQDSALGPAMVANLLLAEQILVEMGAKVAAVGPKYIDQKTRTSSFAVRYSGIRARKIPLVNDLEGPIQTDILIASGSLIRTHIFASVGLMRNDLFIDFVDTEWALRASSKGYRCYCVPDAIMSHSIGDAFVEVFGKKVHIHGDLRRFYRLRNAVYLLRLSTMGWRWRRYILFWLPYYSFLNIYIAHNKLQSTRLLLKAIWEGLTGRLGPAREVEYEPR